MLEIFSRSTTKKEQLFTYEFEVIDVSATSKDRTLYRSKDNVSFCANRTRIQDKDVIYFEIIFTKPKYYKFIVYHSLSKTLTEQYFENFSIVLNNLSDFVSTVKATALEQLKSIMNCLHINPKWTSTHVAAHNGFESFFKEKRAIVSAEVNSQMEDDRMTPMHLAINSHSVNVVRILLEEFKPNLYLVDSKRYSILHCAALSSFETFCVILYHPGIENLISWKNHQGSMAMHLACFAKKYNVVFEFLKFGLTVRQLTLPPPRSSKRKQRKNIPDDLNSATSYSSESRKKRENDPKDKIVRFNEQDLCDIDCQDIEMAGSPLHWVLHRRLLEKLITYKFRMNIPNMLGDTPLHVMTKRKRLRCVITLLCNKSNVKAKNKFGNTPLHHAIKADDIIITQALIVFDADINAKNKIGESVRHLTSKESMYSKIILFLLSSLGAQRCGKDMQGCGPGCSYDGTFDGKCPALLEQNQVESFFHYIKNSTMFERDMQRTPTEEELKNRMNMLTLDGGGVKGLILIQVLIEFQKLLDRPLADYFEWISGTSTGSFVSTYLAIGKSVSEIRSLYFTFKDKVFVGDRPYDAEPLERFNKELVGSDLLMKDLKEKYNKYIMIPAVLYDRIPMRLHLFRSYESYYELLNLKTDQDPGFPRHPSREQAVWKACRASGAAPTYFKSFGPFVDGGLMSNNPTLDSLAEFELLQAAKVHLGRKQECKKLGFVLSVGCGRQQVEEYRSIDISAFSLSLMELNNQIRYAYQMGNLLLFEVCNTDNHVVTRAETFCSATDTIFFRVNPLFNKLVGLDETLDFKIINILWETKRYLYQKRMEIARIVEYLKKYTYFPAEKRETITKKRSESSGVSKKTIKSVGKLRASLKSIVKQTAKVSVIVEEENLKKTMQSLPANKTAIKQEESPRQSGPFMVKSISKKERKSFEKMKQSLTAASISVRGSEGTKSQRKSSTAMHAIKTNQVKNLDKIKSKEQPWNQHQDNLRKIDMEKVGSSKYSKISSEKSKTISYASRAKSEKLPKTSSAPTRQKSLDSKKLSLKNRSNSEISKSKKSVQVKIRIKSKTSAKTAKKSHEKL